MVGSFDAEGELKKIRDLCKVRRRRRYNKSRLDPYRAELVALRCSGASFAEIQLWLRKTKRMKVAASTIQRYLAKLQESTKVTPGSTGKGDDDHGIA